MAEGCRFCSRCQSFKPVSDFVFKDRPRGRRQSWCRGCSAGYKRDWYVRNRMGHTAHVRRLRSNMAARNRGLVWDYFATHPCVDCGGDDPVVLEFDHLRDKRYHVSEMITRGLSWSLIASEIAAPNVGAASAGARTVPARSSGTSSRSIPSVSVSTCRTPRTSSSASIGVGTTRRSGAAVRAQSAAGRVGLEPTNLRFRRALLYPLS